MARVSENSSYHSINYSVNKARQRLEDLQLRGSNLKRIQKPSDDPVGNIELLTIRSQKIDSDQFLRNSSYAKSQLTYTDNALEELTNILVKAKEIAIGQASSIYPQEVRQSIAREVSQLRNQAIGIGNRRLGNRYIFAGHKTLTKPFDIDGTYNGDKATTRIEVSKDYFVPINFSGNDIFFVKENEALKGQEVTPQMLEDPNKSPLLKDNQNELQNSDQLAEVEINTELDKSNFIKRTPANQNEQDLNSIMARPSVFSDLKRLENALISDNHEIIQDILPKVDKHLDRIIEMRTRLGSIVNSIDTLEENIDKTLVMNAEYKSKIEDADVAQLYTDLARQQNVLNATYKASSQLMNNSLLDFIR